MATTEHIQTEGVEPLVQEHHLPLASLTRVLPQEPGRITRVLPQEPGRIEYYICLCGHFGGVSEIQTSLDVSDLFKGHDEISTVTCFRC